MKPGRSARLVRSRWEPELLTTPDGCEEAAKLLGLERLEVNNAIQALEAKPRRTHDEDAMLVHLRARFAQCGRTRSEVLAIKSRLVDERSLTWEKAFVRAAHELLADAPLRAIKDAADRRVAELRRRASTQLVGSAIGVLGAAGAPRTRKEA